MGNQSLIKQLNMVYQLLDWSIAFSKLLIPWHSFKFIRNNTTIGKYSPFWCWANAQTLDLIYIFIEQHMIQQSFKQIVSS